MTKLLTQLGAQRCTLGDIRVDALSREDLLYLYESAIINRSRTLILHQNMHGIYVERDSALSRDIYARADWVYVDGMPVIWMGKAAGLPLKAKHRVTLLDFFDDLLDRASERGWKIFYIGGTQEVLDAGLLQIRSSRDALQIVGRSGFFTPHQEVKILEEIKQYQPDILFVGLGMPLQEHWIARHYDLLEVPVVTTSGATMEYVSGHSRRPAAWAGRFGLYGVLRLLSQPRRLWRRYLLEPLVLLPHLARSVWRERSRQRLLAKNG